MPATNSTTNYELPIFIGTDKPSWMGDWNGAMNKIDAALATAAANATAAMTTANAASTTAQAAQTAVGALETKVNSIETTIQTQAMEISENSQDIQQIQSQISNLNLGFTTLSVTTYGQNGSTKTFNQAAIISPDQYLLPVLIPSDYLYFKQLGAGPNWIAEYGKISGNPFNLQGAEPALNTSIRFYHCGVTFPWVSQNTTYPIWAFFDSQANCTRLYIKGSGANPQAGALSGLLLSLTSRSYTNMTLNVLPQL